MANNILETRILLRYATYSQWMNSEVILLQGEVAVAAFPHASTILNTGNIPENTPPAIGLKIGDGTHYFDELPWVQGIAADVYSWAKTADKPIYNATEIAGLTEFINSVGGGGGGGGGSAAASYRIVYNSNTNKYTLQYYDSEQSEWVDTSSEINLSDIYTRISTIERWANGAHTQLGNIELPLSEYVYEEVLNYINRLNYNDSSVDHQFVTSVAQVNGKISVVRSIISAADITAGTLSTERGGTGLTFIEDDEVLVGSESGEITVRKFVTEINNDRNAFATVGAIKDYVTEMTAGLTSAMHFVGEATVVITQQDSNVDPQITGYIFQNAQPGDVILANNSQEFVWTGERWRLLGDEGSYIIKGGVTNADIIENADIEQSKIAGLIDDLNNKVTVVEGKTLSSNDFTDELLDKLDNIAANAQVNTIEHILVNGTDVPPTVVYDTEKKSVNLQISEFDSVSQSKLASIENGAEVNIIQGIIYGDETLSPNENRIITITPDPHTEHENTIEKIIYDGTELVPNNKTVTITSPIAHENKIEKIIYNGTELIPDGQKAVTITPIEHPQYENKIEKIIYDGSELIPNEQKIVSINSDPHTEHINVIEHIIYDGVELQPNGNKTITITPDPHTEHENKIEQIFINGTEQQPNEDKQVRITIDQAALNLDVITGARVPSLTAGEYEDVNITASPKKLELARVANTGLINDLSQTNNSYFVIYCGSSTEVV